ncbi:hypothetical protein Pla163_22180 [Planctomycetes bacterium Pla163]|uniref:Sodium-dependent bicarbonate transport family permease n=1 Tax=Rohdeia mirabilis TaxID=2528008 RepID=A0A518D0S9_9BACT|nr:hypothetical protein Pla163_22180 [Planctomycetes bacterium Pla163]
MDPSVVLGNLMTPPVLFFLLGMAATLVRSDLEIPQPITKALSLYLLFSIGLHGGAELAMAGLSTALVSTLVVAMGFSCLVPVGIFFYLRKRHGVADAAAIAATYGSISAVTFLTATNFIESRDMEWSGYMVAAMALMESPAILASVALARAFGARGPESDGGGGDGHGARGIFGEAFLNGPVFLLIGALVIGILTGKEGWEKVEPFAGAPFSGVLCLFLLDMGLIAARRLTALKRAGLRLGLFAVVVPLVNAALGIAAAYALGLEQGDALLLTVLAASASYIAVPAAVRITLPDANPSLFLPMSLAVTFPFNVALGIPLYAAVIEALWPPIT